MPVFGEEDTVKLINDLRAMPDGVGRNLGKEFKGAARPVAADAKARARWSTQIPPAIKVTVSSSKKRPGAAIVVPRRIGHARLYEFGKDKRGFRAPLFGDRSHWFQHKKRPYITPAIRAGADGFLEASGRAVDAAAKQNGFR